MSEAWDPTAGAFLEKGLTAQQVEIMRLRFWDLRSIGEIAVKLYMSTDNVNYHLDQAVERLHCADRKELHRAYLEERTRAVWALDPNLASPIKRYAAQHSNQVADVVGGVLVLHQALGLGGLTPDRVMDFLVDQSPWPLPRELLRMATTPTAGEEGDDGAKWALCDIDRRVSDIRDTLGLHVRPFRYFWARRTNDRLDEAAIRGKVLRERYWPRALPLRGSPLGNLLVVHVVVTVTDRAGEDYVLFTRRIDDPRVLAYERGAWSASFEEQCRGDPSLVPGTAQRQRDNSVFETALRGLREELGIDGVQGSKLLSVILEWANGYTGCIVQLELDLRLRSDLTQPDHVTQAWRFKHQDREADAVRLLPFTPEDLIPLVFEGRDPANWLPPPPGQERRLHRTTPVRILHALLAGDKVTHSHLQRIDRALEAFRPGRE